MPKNDKEKTSELKLISWQKKPKQIDRAVISNFLFRKWVAT